VNDTDAETLVLLAIRLRSRGTTEAVTETVLALGDDGSGGDVPVEAVLADVERSGWAGRRGDPSRHSLTPSGSAELTTRLAHITDTAGRATIVAAYETFLPLNRRFLASLSVTAPPDDRFVSVAALVGALAPVLDALSERLTRFARYRPRLQHAVEQMVVDPRWLDAPTVDSVHTVWFELHEHLLATLDRRREGGG
jgi:hypothetical protein